MKNIKVESNGKTSNVNSIKAKELGLATEIYPPISSVREGDLFQHNNGELWLIIQGSSGKIWWITGVGREIQNMGKTFARSYSYKKLLNMLQKLNLENKVKFLHNIRL